MPRKGALCKFQMGGCRSSAGHDHQHRSGRRHASRAIQPEEGALFPRLRGPDRHNVNENQSTRTAMANARSRVAKLEGAMMAVGDTDPTYPGLLEALKQARSQAQVRPVRPHCQHGVFRASTEASCWCSPRGGEGQRRVDFC